jgi:hypothetical protein
LIDGSVILRERKLRRLFRLAEFLRIFDFEDSLIKLQKVASIGNHVEFVNETNDTAMLVLSTEIKFHCPRHSLTAFIFAVLSFPVGSA